MTEATLSNIQYDLTGKRLGATTFGEKTWAFVTRPNVMTAGVVTLFAAAAFAVAQVSPETVDAVSTVLSYEPWWVKQMAGGWAQGAAAVKESVVALAVGAIVGGYFAAKQANFQLEDAERRTNDDHTDSLPLSRLAVEKNKFEPITTAQQMDMAHELHIRSRRAVKALWVAGVGSIMCPWVGVGAFGLGVVAPMMMQNNSNINRMAKVRHYEWRLAYRRREP